MERYACQRCGRGDFRFGGELIRHVMMHHAHERRFTYTCTLRACDSRNCCITLKTAFAFKNHMYRTHRSIMQKKETETELNVATEGYISISCPVCHSSVPILSALSSHYRLHCESETTVYCPIEGCSFEFIVYSSYTSHMTRHHGASKLVIKPSLLQCLSVVDCNAVDSGALCETEASESTDDVTHHVALILLKLQESCMLACSTVQSIIETMQHFLEMAGTNSQQAVMKACQMNNIAPEICGQVLTALASAGLMDSFSELGSISKRNQYYKERLNYVESKTVKFASDDDSCVAHFEYVSLLESLKLLLENAKIRSKLTLRNSSVGILTDFSDGTLCKSHEFFRKHDDALQLVLYSDEFEVVNPLGPHAAKHKILAFYYTVSNLKLLQSQKDAIQLLALCNASDVKKYGLEALANRFFNELNMLEQGIEIRGLSEKVRGSIAFIAGDNLNSHILGGFNASFGPKVFRPCRFCMITSADLQNVYECDNLEIRTMKMYNDHVDAISKDQSLKTYFGVRYQSSFNRGTFHVVDRLPPDIMHDLLEGVVPYEMALVLQQLISKGFVAVSDMNNIIRTFPYGALDKQNKPVPISETFGDRIKQNAGRMWCLLRLLPVMIGHLVPESNVHWRFLLDLKDIVEVSFSDKLAESHLWNLTMKIQDHLFTFKNLFPNKNLLPKHHFMLHYPRMISVLGPLRQAWCMRFESKHLYFSRLVKVVHNFKNICSTLALRHQLMQAYYLSTDNAYGTDEVLLSKTVEIDASTLSAEVIDLLFSSGFVKDLSIYVCRRVTLSGIAYYKQMFVVVTCNNEDIVFGRVQDIFVQQAATKFLVHFYKSTYVTHLSAYAIVATDKRAVLSVADFCDYYPLSAYESNGQKYIVLKNFIFDIQSYNSS